MGIKINAEDIRADKEKLYKQIADAKADLERLQILCPHENKAEGNYSWRIGAIDRAMLCEDCGKCIEILSLGFIKPMS